MVSSYMLEGAWYLDYAGCYGGWVIVEANSPGYGISHPFGHSRRRNREFYDAFHLVLNVLNFKEHEERLAINR